jgi:hypothetical protein
MKPGAAAAVGEMIGKWKVNVKVKVKVEVETPEGKWTELTKRESPSKDAP